MNRRCFLRGVVSLPIAHIIVPAWAQAPRYFPADFGPIGQGNDTAAIQGAINAARSYNNNRGGIVEFDSRAYRVSDFDCTGCQNLVLQGHGGSWFYASEQTQPAAIFDFTGSARCRLISLVAAGQQYINGNPPTVVPLAGFLLAESSVGGDSGTMMMYDCGTVGYFESSPLGIIGSTDNEYTSIRLQQDKSSRPALNISTLPDWYILSRYKTITSSASNVGDQTFTACEFHGRRTVPYSQYWTTYMRNADNVRFLGGVHDCSGRAHMLFQGNCRRITSIGQKFYSESGSSPSYVFEDQGSCSDLCVINPNTTDNAFNVGIKTGSFPNYREL